MRIRRLVISLIVIALLVAGGYFAYQQFLAPPTETADSATASDTVVVDTGVDLVSAEGQIVPVRHAALTFQTGGEVVEILVTEGQTVRAGDPLLRLDATDLEIALRQAEAGLAQAQANLTAANAGLLAAQAGADSAQVSVDTAQVGISAAEAQLALVQADPLPEEIAAAESGVRASASGIDQAAANRDATLEIPDSQVRSAEAQVAAAFAEQRNIQETYDKLIRAGVGGTPEEQTRFALNAAVANLNAAQAALDELNEGATDAQRRAANAAVAVAIAQRDSAQAQLELVQAGVKAEQITVAEVGVAQAQAAVAQAQAAVPQAEASVTQAEAAVAQAESGVRQAQAALDAAQAALDKSVLNAPFVGTVASVSLELGEVASPGVPVVTLADFSQWLVETTDLTELDVVAVSVGYPVEVRVDAIPDEVINGTVTDIADVSTLTRGDITYAVTIALDEASDLPLRWGMTVFVDVDVDQ
jgi:HlyD family secretion protein